jgi:hypothetical protein
MKIQLLKNDNSELKKNSLIIVFDEIEINHLLKLSKTHKILIVSNNNYYKNIKLNNVYFLNSDSNYLCFNGIVFLAFCNSISDSFKNLIEKWIDYKLVVITNTLFVEFLDNKNFIYINPNSQSIIDV